jgi:hypothetical protein
MKRRSFLATVAAALAFPVAFIRKTKAEQVKCNLIPLLRCTTDGFPGDPVLMKDLKVGDTFVAWGCYPIYTVTNPPFIYEGKWTINCQWEYHNGKYKGDRLPELERLCQPFRKK